MYTKIDLCFDMGGCPNNCCHCWIKTDGKGFVKESNVRKISSQFKQLTRNLGVYTWYLEPDYLPTYKELWKLEMELSSEPHQHYELLSDWRVLRDKTYLKWIYTLGVRTCQLTFFGMQESTNRMTGRANAFNELMEVTDKLIKVGISPRYQLFVYDFNVHELKQFNNYIKEKGIEKKCKDYGLEFSMFVHVGSCVGNAMKLYDGWLTEKNITNIPMSMIESSKNHFGKNDIKSFLGEPESKLYNEIIKDNKTQPIVVNDIILYIDGKLDVYPHFAVQKPWWKIGNLNIDLAEDILKRYVSGETIGQQVRNTVPLSEMIKKFGNADSKRMFLKSDYIEYITERYLESINC